MQKAKLNLTLDSSIKKELFIQACESFNGNISAYVTHMVIGRTPEKRKPQH